MPPNIDIDDLGCREANKVEKPCCKGTKHNLVIKLKNLDLCLLRQIVSFPPSSLSNTLEVGEGGLLFMKLVRQFWIFNSLVHSSRIPGKIGQEESVSLNQI